MDAELKGCEVLSVWEHFVPTERVWLIMVGYRVASTRRERGEETSPRARHSRQRVKAADQLDPQERAIYESLRAWRRALAQARQIGPHFILTNAQLIEVIKRRPMTLVTRSGSSATNTSAS